MRSRLRSLILRELPNPLRWIVAEILYFLDWIDRTVGTIAKGMRESPAWYFMTMIGSFAVFLTFMLFLSVIDQTSGRGSRALPVRATANLSRRDLEVLNEWTVQDHWRVAHFFVLDQPRQRPRDISLDSRLNTLPESVAQSNSPSRSKHASAHASRANRSNPQNSLDVRLDLSRPKVAQHGTRIVAGTVLDPGFQIAEHSLSGREHDLERHTRAQAPQLLVQASWEFGPECNAREYVSVPVRRSKPFRVPMPEPEPEPEPEPVPVPARQTSPDLSLEMAMIRHFSVEGLVPPGAHLVQSSDRSRFEMEERSSSRDFAANQLESSKWRESRPSSRRRDSNPPPYEGLGKFDPLSHDHPQDDEYDETLRAVADVALRIELEAPATVASGTLQQSRLHVTNEGQDQISRIEVRDFPAHLKTIVGADPEATTESIVDPATGLRQTALHRELPPLLPGDERDLTLDWIPDGPRQQTQRTHVIAHTEVSTFTRVTRPPADQPMPSVPPEQVQLTPALSCDIAHLDRVYLGDEIDLEITVRNTGDTTLHDVKVAVDVPSQLSHRSGRTVVIDAGNLPVNGKRQTSVKLAAIRPGEAVNRLRIDASEQVEARGQTSIQVVERRKSERKPAPVTQTGSESVPTPRTPTQRPPAKPKPLPIQPVDECCCQRVTMFLEQHNRLVSWTD